LIGAPYDWLVSWTAVVAAVLLTVLLLDCVLLGIALVGSGPAPGGQPLSYLLELKSVWRIGDRALRVLPIIQNARPIPGHFLREV
jgi:hypothetical protein